MRFLNIFIISLLNSLVSTGPHFCILSFRLLKDKSGVAMFNPRKQNYQHLPNLTSFYIFTFATAVNKSNILRISAKYCCHRYQTSLSRQNNKASAINPFTPG